MTRRSRTRLYRQLSHPVYRECGPGIQFDEGQYEASREPGKGQKRVLCRDLAYQDEPTCKGPHQYCVRLVSVDQSPNRQTTHP
jgi:hypothetical protein